MTTLLTVLSKARHCNASDPRDKIYALLPLQGLYDLELPPGLKPNYSNPVASIFADCAAALLETDNFDVLSAVQGTSTLPDLPSWVTDWSLSPQRFVFGEISSTPRLRCPMRKVWGGDDSDENEFENQPGTRHLWTKTVSLSNGKQMLGAQASGYLAGRIAKLGSTYLAGQTPFPMKEWMDIAVKSEAVRAIDRVPDVALNYTDAPNRHVFECVLSVAGFSNMGMSGFLRGKYRDKDCTDHLDFKSWRPRPGVGEDGPRENSQDRFEQLIRETAEVMRATGTLGEQEPVPYAEIPFHRAAKEIGISPSAYVQYVLRHCHSRRFFVTDAGYMGLAPSEAEVGDEVRLFVGAGFPFVLRKKEGVTSQDGGILYHLVGEGYMEERPWMVAKEKPRCEAETVTIV